MLAEGELDVALVSSFEFLRNPIYRIVDDISISSDGPVYSVVVAHDSGTPLSEIELDPASLTSVALLECLMNLRGWPFRGTKITADVLSPLKPGGARLLIGDQAIRFRRKFSTAYQYLDLGQEWNDATNLPFVFALWLVRRELKDAEALGDELRTLRNRNLEKIDQICANHEEFEREFCRRYFTRNLRFSLGQREKAGLQEFANACGNFDLIPKRKLDLELV
jgi:chorismate dehydratase